MPVTDTNYYMQTTPYSNYYFLLGNFKDFFLYLYSNRIYLRKDSVFIL